MNIQSKYLFWQDAWQENAYNMQNLTLVSKELQKWLQEEEKIAYIRNKNRNLIKLYNLLILFLRPETKVSTKVMPR